MTDFYFDGERLADHAQKANAAFARIGHGLHAWAQRNATTANLRLLRAWIGDAPPLDERPTRGDLKAWVKTTLDDHDDLARRFAERGQLYDRQAKVIADLVRERDAAREGVKAGAERMGAQIKAYEELRTAYEAAEAERNRYAHENAALRVELAQARRASHPDYVLLRLGEVAASDVDV